MTDNQNNAHSANGGKAFDEPVAEFRLNPVHLVLGLFFGVICIWMILQDARLAHTAIIGLLISSFSVASYLFSRINVYGDRLEIRPVLGAGQVIEFQAVTRVEKTPTRLSLHVDGMKKPFVLTSWFIKQPDLSRMAAMIDERVAARAG